MSQMVIDFQCLRLSLFGLTGGRLPVSQMVIVIVWFDRWKTSSVSDGYCHCLV